MNSDIEQINVIIHEFSRAGQMFRSYTLFLQNQDLTKTTDKLKEVADRCSQRCLELRNLMLQTIIEDENKTEVKDGVSK